MYEFTIFGNKSAVASAEQSRPVESIYYLEFTQLTLQAAVQTLNSKISLKITHINISLITGTNA